MNETPYNPLEKINLAVSIVNALLAQTPRPLPPLESFPGAGIYALYYIGGFPEYRLIAERNRGGQFRLPIYVGKAIPKGGRIGGLGSDQRPTTALFSRLREHAESIRQVVNLDLSDFTCRFLPVDDIWIPLGENLLIDKFRPAWNSGLGGFGNHDPGGGRYQGARPEWDVVHEGRPWAERCQPNPKTKEDLLIRVRDYIEGRLISTLELFPMDDADDAAE